MYNILDLLGDIGGLYDALIFIGSLFMFIFSSPVLENHLIQRLFKVENDDRKKGRKDVKAKKMPQEIYHKKEINSDGEYDNKFDESTSNWGQIKAKVLSWIRVNPAKLPQWMDPNRKRR